MIYAFILYSALASIVPDSKVVVPAPASVTSKPTQQELVDLLTLMRPRQAAIDAEQAVFDAGAASTFRDNPDFKELEADFPGFTDRFVAELRKIVAAKAPAAEDRLRAKMLPILAKELTGSEVRSLLDFYSSSAGLSIIEQMLTESERAASANFSHMANSETITIKQVTQLGQSAAESVRLSGRQQEALAEFMKTPAFASLNRVQAKLLAESVAHANLPDPQMDREIEAVVQRLMGELKRTDATKP